jgi:type IV pilus assembly protein PilB
VRADRQTLEESSLDPVKYADYPFYEGRGCIECNGTGFRGRAAIAELLDLSDQIRQMILDRRSAADIKRVAREEGMFFLRDSAVRKVLAGHTTLREVNKVTFVE